MVSHTQKLRLLGALNLFIQQQFGAVKIGESVLKAMDIFSRLLRNSLFPRNSFLCRGGKKHAQYHHTAADSAANAATAYPIAHTAAQSQTLALRKPHFLMEGRQNALGTVAAFVVIVPRCNTFLCFIHSIFFASSFSFLKR